MGQKCPYRQTHLKARRALRSRAFRIPAGSHPDAAPGRRNLGRSRHTRPCLGRIHSEVGMAERITADDAIAHAARILHEAELERTNPVMMERLDSIADTWVTIAQLLAERERA